MMTIDDIFEQIGTAKIAEATGHTNPNMWKTRGSIPAEYDFALVNAAREIGVNLTTDMLAEMRDAKRKERV